MFGGGVVVVYDRQNGRRTTELLHIRPETAWRTQRTNTVYELKIVGAKQAHVALYSTTVYKDMFVRVLYVYNIEVIVRNGFAHAQQIS